MADVEINKPKTEKTSASVTSFLPRLCPTTTSDIKDASFYTPRTKSLLLENNSNSDDFTKRPGFGEYTKINLHKSKLTELYSDKRAFSKYSSLPLISPRNYRGHIPIPQRNLLGMSTTVTRPQSPSKKNSPKDLKSTNKVKTITLDNDTKKKNKTSSSRSSSPGQKQRASFKGSKSRNASPPVGVIKTPDKTTSMKRGDGKKQSISPRVVSPTKRKAKVKVSSASNFEVALKDTAGKPSSSTRGDGVLKQASQPSFCVKENLLFPQEKISLDHLKNEVYAGDQKRLSFEKLHLCIEKSVENLSLAERKRSYLVTYSSEDIKNKEGLSLSFLQNLSSASITTFTKDLEEKKDLENKGVKETKSAIRTLSGHELVLTPSMKLEMEKTDIENDSLEISDLLHQTGENFIEAKEIHIFQDDANEYDSEMSTDGELSRKEELKRLPSIRLSCSKNSDLNKKSESSLWKSREAELLNDVDYRQSVYHPAVSRRQPDEPEDTEFRPKSNTIDDNCGCSCDTSERISRSRSPILKNKFSTPMFMADQIDSCNNEGSWVSSFDNAHAKPMYETVIQDVPLYDIKRIRTKKERVSGALLRLTLKVIRLLALFNLWPGDNCYMLTSQSLRFAR